MQGNDLEGRVSLVTGASRGLGRAIALKLANLGSKVAINYQTSDEQASKLAREIEGNGGEAVLAKANVAESRAVRVMTKEVVDNANSMPFHDAFEYMLRMVSAIKVGAEWCDI